MADYTRIDAYRRRKVWRYPARPSQRGRKAVMWRARSALAEVRMVALGGFLATLIYLQTGWPIPWNANPADPALLTANRAANDWQAPANLPRPIVSSPAPPVVGIGAGVAATGDTLRARFHLCHSGGGTNCVVDGDTFWFQGQKIRIADIDTPETHSPRCAEEARLGAAATARLQDLLNAGPFTLEAIDRDTDSYGRALRTVTRGGESLGGVLVDEGLARWYGGGRQPWC
jgi:micrococcal nuclease